MAFVVKATRRDDGNYDLSYGKGSKKLTGIAQKSGTGWTVLDAEGTVIIAPHELKRDAQALWGKWAQKNYTGIQSGVDETETETGTPDQPEERDTSPATHLPPAGPPRPGHPGAPIPPLEGLIRRLADDRAGLQDLIDTGPSDDDKIRRWYGVYHYLGLVLMLPPVAMSPLPVTPPSPPAVSKPPTFSGPPSFNPEE